MAILGCMEKYEPISLSLKPIRRENAASDFSDIRQLFRSFADMRCNGVCMNADLFTTAQVF